MWQVRAALNVKARNKRRYGTAMKIQHASDMRRRLDLDCLAVFFRACNRTFRMTNPS
ncbi:hypothetical protein D3C72_2409670 [compost metagenome]